MSSGTPSASAPTTPFDAGRLAQDTLPIQALPIQALPIQALPINGTVQISVSAPEGAGPKDHASATTATSQSAAVIAGANDADGIQRSNALMLTGGIMIGYTALVASAWLSDAIFGVSLRSQMAALDRPVFGAFEVPDPRSVIGTVLLTLSLSALGAVLITAGIDLRRQQRQWSALSAEQQAITPWTNRPTRLGTRIRTTWALGAGILLSGLLLHLGGPLNPSGSNPEAEMSWPALLVTQAFLYLMLLGHWQRSGHLSRLGQDLTLTTVRETLWPRNPEGPDRGASQGRSGQKKSKAAKTRRAKTRRAAKPRR